MNIYHGTIISCDASESVFSYLVEDKGKILYTGDILPEEYKNIPLRELGTKALIPAFADSHMHFSSFALFHSGVNVSECSSNREILQTLSAVHEDSREEILIGFGISPHSVEEGELVTRGELDKAVPDNPVFLVKYDGHACVINSTLLKMLPKKIPQLRGYNAESGEMQQEAFFAVTDYITGSVSPNRLIHTMLEAYDFLTKQGFGMLHTVSGVGYPRDLDVDLERWIGRGLGTGFQTRLFFQTMNVRKVNRRKLPRIGGCFATALDGCFGSVDAALYKPYEATKNRGILYYNDEEVTDFCKRANRDGLQIEMHAIGDRAFDQAARALDAALRDCPREDHRHGIIHACLPTDKGMDLCARNRIQIPLQPVFLNWAQEPSSYLKDILGEEREASLNPLRTLWDRGLLLSGGSDAPVTTPDAILGIHKACNHPVPSQSLTVQEALKLFTINGYKASFDDNDRGSLEPGKIADMAVLSGNPLDMPVEKINTLTVEQTILGGDLYHSSDKSSFLTLLHGIFSNTVI